MHKLILHKIDLENNWPIFENDEAHYTHTDIFVRVVESMKKKILQL